jgi:hypothetical protein
VFVPYTQEANDMRFAVPGGFPDGDAFFTYLKDTFDVLYRDGQEGRPRMMSLGLHGRLAGRPGRTAASWQRASPERDSPPAEDARSKKTPSSSCSSMPQARSRSPFRCRSRAASSR